METQYSIRSGKYFDSFLVFLSLAVLLGCLFFTYAYLVIAPFPGFEWDSQQLIITVESDTTKMNLIHTGDQLIAFGDLTWETYSTDRRRVPFEGLRTGDKTSITLVRDDKTLRMEWQMVGPTQASVVSRLVSTLIATPFWLVGTIVALFLRPRDKRWLLLISFNYLVAIWFTAGSVSPFHVVFSSLIQHSVAWLLALVTLHLHLVVPEPVFHRQPRYLMPILYGTAVLLASLELFQVFPASAYTLGLLLAFSGSLGLLAYRSFARHSLAEKLAARLMLTSFVLAFGPGFVLWTIPILLNIPALTNLSTIITVLAVSLLPLTYTYVIFKHSLGSLEFRANRLLASASFVLLNVLAFGVVFSLLRRYNASYDAMLGFGFAWTVVMVGNAAYLQSRYQRLVDWLAYGTRYDPDEIIHVFAQRIPNATDFASLTQLLASNLFPSLLIRQTALYMISDSEATLVYSTGLDLKEKSLTRQQIDRTLAKAGQYLPALTGTGEVIHQGDWVRLALPLKVRDETIGAWLFGRRDPDDFYAQGDITLLKTLASQVAVAVENSRLFQNLSAQLVKLQALYDVSESVVHTQGLDQILQVVVDRAIASIPQAEKVVIHLMDPGGEMLLPRAISGNVAEPAKSSGLRLDQSLAGRAVREQQLVHSPDVSNDPDFIDTGPGIRSLVVMPLVVGCEVLGTLSVDSSRTNAFDEATFSLLSSLGNQAAVAVKKAQIDAELIKSIAIMQQRSDELEVSLTHLQNTQSQLIQAEKLASLGTLSAGRAG